MAGKAWDIATQFTATCPGATWEFGTATTSGNTIEVGTRLKAIRLALMCHTADPGTDYSLWCDRVITEGAVTFQADDDAEFSYLLIGY